MFVYPTDAEVVVAQINVDDGGRRPIPLLTLYGDRRVVAAVGDSWLTGTATELGVQDFFDDAEGVGLLDGDLVLRSPVDSTLPDIGIELVVGGRRFEHELDLARIERPIALRAFLQRTVGGNVFDLTTAYEPPSWLTCDDRSCTASAAPTGSSSRPVLPHEDVAALAVPPAGGTATGGS